MYEAVEEATRNEFELLAELGGGAAWAAFLGRPLAGRGPLVVLLLQAAEEGGGEFDLETVEALDDGLPLGRTGCTACGAEGEGWPRFCPACGTDLTGVPADAAVPGGSAEALLDEVRGAAAGVYDVLGAMPHAEGGGALYFAREGGTGRVVGLTLRTEADGELDLVVSWTPAMDSRADDGPAALDEAVREDEAAPSAVRHTAIPAGSVAWSGDDGADAPHPLFEAPTRRRAGARDRGRRAVGIAAVGIVGVALVAALVAAFRNPSPSPVAGSSFSGETVARPRPGPAAAGPAAAAPADPAPGSTPPAVSAGSAAAAATPAPPPRPVSTFAAPTTAAGASTSTAAASVPATVTAPAASPAPAAVPTPEGITEAIGRYAAAVQSRQTSRITRAYPGITPAEVDRWERFFRPLAPDAGLEARYEALGGPTVSGTRGEILFTLTLSYTDGTGKAAVMPLPLRAILEWTGGGWSLREVRSYP